MNTNEIFSIMYHFIFILSLIPLIWGCTKENINTPADGPTKNNKADYALHFCKNNNMNEEFCILVDMSIHSGKKRLFVYDFKEHKVLSSYLVSHGCCDNIWSSDQSKTNPSFSNVPDSHCSSLGKFKIGERGYSSFGVNTKYLLHGLESTNSNALERDIVFHSWSMVNDEETFPQGTPEGWGCPALSNNSFLEIDELLKNADKPTLMWIYD